MNKCVGSNLQNIIDRHLTLCCWPLSSLAKIWGKKMAGKKLIIYLVCVLNHKYIFGCSKPVISSPAQFQCYLPKFQFDVLFFLGFFFCIFYSSLALLISLPSNVVTSLSIPITLHVKMTHPQLKLKPKKLEGPITSILHVL